MLSVTSNILEILVRFPGFRIKVGSIGFCSMDGLVGSFLKHSKIGLVEDGVTNKEDFFLLS